ncbi:MAG: hypothetical protein WKG07_23280 [Hymenobacter sp.]
MEHDKLTTQPMSRMALLIELNNASSIKATFTLNPNVDQNWLIEADLEKLREYFGFTLPTDRWPSAVAATGAPGTLKRQGHGWQVGEKAKLIVS